MSAAFCRAAVLSLVVGGQAGPAAAAGIAELSPRAPYELTRSLQALQDQVAFGSDAALSAQTAMHLHIVERFLATDRDAWRHPANARAAIVYVLSGGRPQILRDLVDEEILPADMTELARGALAYAAGDRRQAWRHLKDIDARELPPSLGAHLALVQATLTIDADPRAAIGYLETARLLAPGTLIEEAALRRQLSAASTLADAESFIFLARQYFRRFPRSVYAPNLFRVFPDLWAKLGLERGEESFGRLEETLSELPAEPRLKLYLSIASSTLVGGDLQDAALAAARAAELAGPDGPDSARALFYEAAALAAGIDPVRGLAALHEFDVAALPDRDAELYGAAVAVAETVQQAPQGAGLQKFDADELEAAAVLERARTAIAAADVLLGMLR